MSKYDPTRPVSSIKHDDKRAAIPDSAHQGEEQMAISGQPEKYTIFFLFFAYLFCCFRFFCNFAHEYPF